MMIWLSNDLRFFYYASYENVPNILVSEQEVTLRIGMYTRVK